MAIRLDVGSGGRSPDPEWLGVDLFAPEADVRAPMDKLPFPDGSVDEIFSSHALEHLGKFDVARVLREWHRVLRPGGKLTVRVPDLKWCCRWWLDHQTTGWDLDVIFGNQTRPGEFHCTGFNRPIMDRYLTEAGFRINKYEELQTHSQKTMSFEAEK